MTPGMLSETDSAAILSYVRNLRLIARDDKAQAKLATSPERRDHHLAERRRRLIEALRWRRDERRFRASTIRRELLRSQLNESVRLLDAAE